jgi:phosphoribosylglycinamide formyltransferase-1
MPARLAVLISGRGSNLAALLAAADDGVLAGRAAVVAVAADRPAPGLEQARQRGLPTIVVPGVVSAAGRAREESEAELLAALAPHRPDLVVLAGYRRVLSPLFLAAHPGRVVNIHPADTRRHRGLGGYAWAHAAGLERTTITVHLVDEGVDTGPILAQREVDLRGAASLEEVERRGLLVEHELYPEAIGALVERLGLG